jgi:predicted TIM-barrel fold metal-dependent hydrolase
MISIRHLPVVVGAIGFTACLVLAARPIAQQQQPPATGASQAAPPGGGRQGGRGGSIQIQPGQECPPGTTETRPRSCQAPGIPPPTIVDYRPTSTLVTPEHLVPKAKFPAIDYHGHPRGLVDSVDGIASLIASLDSLNVRTIVLADNLSGERLQKTVELVRRTPHKDRIQMLAGIDLRDVGPGSGEKAVRQLEADLKAGAVGVGEINKSFGMSITKADGTRLKIDDPDLDPVWAACARLNVPVFIHTGDPQALFEPIDFKNERWLELALYADRRYRDRVPPFEELMAERDRLFKKHPKTRFVAAHMGWHANDLGRLSRMLDAMPNVSVEVAAVLYDIGRQPRAAREFFIKYQDRILFGKDSFQPEEYPYYWRVFETADEYFDYYRHYHAFWKLYGLDLPDDVLKKLYHRNALKLAPGLPQAGWP